MLLIGILGVIPVSPTKRNPWGMLNLCLSKQNTILVQIKCMVENLSKGPGEAKNHDGHKQKSCFCPS